MSGNPFGPVAMACLLASLSAAPAHAMGRHSSANPAPADDNGIDLTSIPPAHTPQEAYARFEVLKGLVLRAQANGPMSQFQDNGLGFTDQALAKLALGEDVDAINRSLLDPGTTVYARVGSDFHDLGFLCARTGDYDFGLRGLVALTYLYGDKPWLIWPQTRRRLLDYFLDQKGNGVLEKVSFGLCGTHDETENHVLMTEGSRYLTNQLVLQDLASRGIYDPQYDNEANGMNRWMLQHLQRFFQHDFFEYNSRPYQAYTVMAIENIAAFATDSRVQLAAEMLLNYLDAKYAVSSDNLRRYVPFRRQPGYKDRTDLLQIDDESQRMILMAGATELFDELPRPNWLDFGFDRMMVSALMSYRTPELILDLIVDKSHAPYFQAYHHDGIEMYAGNGSFLISAGGVFVPKWDWFSTQMDGWALPTSLIPARGGLDAKQFIRFLGSNDDGDRVNTCVAPGFACGLNVVIPDSIPDACRETAGHWTFVDFTSVNCPLKYGFFAAVYVDRCDSDECGVSADNYGFLEAQEPSQDLNYAEFKRRVLARNEWRQFSSAQESEYATATGHVIRFIPVTGDKLDWGIRSWDGRAMTTDLNTWPLAYGDIVRADGAGKVEIRNPYLRRKLTLDMRDFMHPCREETAL